MNASASLSGRKLKRLFHKIMVNLMKKKSLTTQLCAKLSFFLFSFSLLPSGFAQTTCPNVEGNYRVAGFGATLGDAVQVFDTKMAAFSDSEVKIVGNVNSKIAIYIKSGSLGKLSTQANTTWYLGSTYRCKDGWLEFIQPVQAERSIEGVWYQGETTIRIAPSQAGLAIESSFTGRQRVILFSYEGANVSLPKLGTKRTLVDAIRWPSIFEPVPAKKTPEIPEAKTVIEMRQMLNSSVRGNILLGVLKEADGAILATLRARSADDIAPFEDRLRAASIAFETKLAPIWSDGAYQFTMLLRTSVANAVQSRQLSSKYSAFRIQQELKKIGHPMVDVTKVVEQENDYVATMNVLNDVGADEIMLRIKNNVSLVGSAHLTKENVHPTSEKIRVLEFRLTVK